MGLISKTYTFSTGATILATEHNTNYDTLYNWANGNVDNANVKAGANISLSKLSLSDDVTFTGDVSFTNAATTDDIFTITGSSITTGSLLKVYSNSADTSARNILEIINDNAAADAAVPLQIQQDGDAAHINLTGDPANSTPVDGDFWYDGTNFKGYDGTNSITLESQLVQEVATETGTAATGTTLMVLDNSIPQNDEGNEYMTLAITPKATTNKLEIVVTIVCGSSGARQQVIALYQDATANALAAVPSNITANSEMRTISFTHYMDAGTTSETTFKVRAGNVAGDTFHFNSLGSGTGAVLSGTCASSIVIREIKV